ncbi:MAG: ATP-binding cassette domain-containing protein, partial [Planctomycetota bacterium]
MNANPRPLLQLSDLRKRYGTVTVVDDVSLTIHAGQIHALLGANGAGKSTLVRMIAGLVSPSGGQMKFHSEPYAPGGKREAERSGVEIVQQELNLISTLSVAENLMLSRLPSAIGIIGQRQLHTRARAALDRFGIDDVATDTLVGCLGVGKQQMVEIAAALDRDCRLLILDEPTAALSAAESELLFQRLDALRSVGTQR